MRNKLIVDGDKEVIIKRIQQWHTYGGLLEGMPTTRLNTRILHQTKEDAKRICGVDEIYVIEPVQEPIHYEGKYAFGDPAALPGVTCVAQLWYCFPFRDQTKDFSLLGIVWFQQDYAFPIDDDALEEIKKIPFSKLCGEYSY